MMSQSEIIRPVALGISNDDFFCNLPDVKN